MQSNHNDKSEGTRLRAKLYTETRHSVTSPQTLQLKTTEMGHFFTSYIIVAGVSFTTYPLQKAILLHFMTVICDKYTTLFINVNNKKK